MPELSSITAHAQEGDPVITRFRVGESIRKSRQEQKLSVTKLAEQANISKSNLSKIENGIISPTFETLERISGGLGLTAASLLSDRDGNSEKIVFTKHGCGQKAAEAHYSFEFLFTGFENRRMVPFITTINSLEVSDFKQPASHGGEEFIYVLSGAVVLIGALDQPQTLEQGDGAYFDSQVRHLVVNKGKERSTLLWVWSE